MPNEYYDPPYVTDAELAGNGGSFEASWMFSYLSEEVQVANTSPPIPFPLVWDEPSIVSNDITINQSGNVEFITDGIYAITFTAVIDTSADAEGIILLQWGYNSEVGNFLAMSDTTDVCQLTADLAYNHFFHLPPQRFEAGDTVSGAMSSIHISAGSYTINSTSSIYVIKIGA